MRSLFLLFALACTQASTSGAQQPDTVRSLFDRAHRGNWYLRAHLADSTIVEGRVPRLRVDSALVGRTSVGFAEVTALDRRLRVASSAKQVGIGSGLLFGAFGAALYAGLCESNCSGLGVIGGGAAGFATGFTIGGLIGGAINPGRVEWRPLWPPSAVAAFSERKDSVRPWSPRVTTFYFASSFERGDVPALVPYLFGLQLAGLQGNLEFTVLDVFTTWDGPAQGLAAITGANWHISESNYVGAAAGVADVFHDNRTLAVARIGVHTAQRQGLRLELRAITTLRDPRPVGYVVVGYDIRGRR